MGWFGNDEIVTNTNSVSNTSNATVEQILTAAAVVIIACVVTFYVIAKVCNKMLNSRMSSAARREYEISRLNNGAVRTNV